MAKAVDTPVDEAVLITAKAGSGDQKASAQWNPGASLDEAVEMYGEEIVFSYFKSHGTRNLQNSIRSILASGKTAEEVAKELADWKPGISRRVSADPVGKFIKAFGNMEPEAQASMLQRLQGVLAAANGQSAE